MISSGGAISSLLGADKPPVEKHYAARHLNIVRELLKEEKKIQAIQNPEGYLEKRKDRISEITAEVDKKFEQWYNHYINEGFDEDRAKAAALKHANEEATLQHALVDSEYPLDVLGIATQRAVVENPFSRKVGIVGATAAPRRSKAGRKTRRSKKH